jgi:hypothetical protein
MWGAAPPTPPVVAGVWGSRVVAAPAGARVGAGVVDLFRPSVRPRAGRMALVSLYSAGGGGRSAERMVRGAQETAAPDVPCATRSPNSLGVGGSVSFLRLAVAMVAPPGRDGPVMMT